MKFYKITKNRLDKLGEIVAKLFISCHKVQTQIEQCRLVFRNHKKFMVTLRKLELLAKSKKEASFDKSLVQNLTNFLSKQAVRLMKQVDSLTSVCSCCSG
jgi:hypothetical protein